MKNVKLSKIKDLAYHKTNLRDFHALNLNRLYPFAMSSDYMQYINIIYSFVNFHLS